MIERMVEALRRAGCTTDPVEVAEMLWLAQHARSSAPDTAGNASTMPFRESPPPPFRPAPGGMTTPAERAAGMYPDTGSPGTGDALADAVRGGGPRVPALRETLPLGRALRPLRRRVPSRRMFVLDERATADQIADTGLWLPAMRPVMERRYRATVLVDSSASMLVWRPTINAFLTLLAQVGAFQSLRVYTVDSDATAPVLLHRGTVDPAVSPLSIDDPTGRTVILVITDGIGAAWSDGWMAGQLRDWAKSSPVQVIDLLPPRLWRSTGLVTGQPSGRRGVSITELSAAGLSPRAKQIAAEQPATAPVLIYGSQPSATGPEPATAAARVRQFVHNASPTAQRLANCLAAAPLTLPIMRLVQHVMLPESSTVHLAEVFVSGLLRRRTDDAVTDPELMGFDFLPGVRDLLLDIADRYDTVQVLTEVSRFVSDRLGQPFDFPALFMHPDDPLPDLGTGALPFAHISASALRRLGPRYSRLADRLDQAALSVVRPPQPSDPARPSDAIEGYPLSGSGTRAVFLTMLRQSERDTLALSDVLMRSYHLRPATVRHLTEPLESEVVEAVVRAAQEADDTLLICASGQFDALFSRWVATAVETSHARNVLIISEGDARIPLRAATALTTERYGLMRHLARLLDEGDPRLPPDLSFQDLYGWLRSPSRVDDVLLRNPPSVPRGVLGPNPMFRNGRYAFISYSRAEEAYATRIRDFLTLHAGIPIWTDHSVAADARWSHLLRERIDACGAVIVIVSRQSAESLWVGRELSRAREMGKPVLALRLDDTRVPSDVDTLASVQDRQMPDEAFVRRLRQRLGLYVAEGTAATIEASPVGLQVNGDLQTVFVTVSASAAGPLRDVAIVAESLPSGISCMSGSGARFSVAAGATAARALSFAAHGGADLGSSTVTLRLEPSEPPVTCDMRITVAPARTGVTRITGAVLDASTGGSLRDADVVLSDRVRRTIFTMRTDADGTFEFEADAATHGPVIDITAQKDGYSRVTTAYHAVPGGPRTAAFRFELTPTRVDVPPAIVTEPREPVLATASSAAPAFFLSYARSSAARANQNVERFYRDLQHNLSQLLPEEPERQTGFMDRHLEAGTRWQPELLRMVGTCRVFVALLSEPYLFHSNWCAMEWDLFSRRTVRSRRRDGGPSHYSQAILPVIWAPITSRIPLRVNRVQRFLPTDLPERFVETYRSDGILGAMRVDSSGYEAIVWKLALEIQERVASYDVAPLLVHTTDGLRRTFRGGDGD